MPAPPPSAGQLRERVTVQKRTGGTADGGGGAPQTWANQTTRWAEIIPLTVNQRLNALALALEVNYRVRLRFEDDLFDLDSDVFRLVWRSKIMHIMGAVNVDQRRRFVEVTCKLGQTISS